MRQIGDDASRERRREKKGTRARAIVTNESTSELAIFAGPIQLPILIAENVVRDFYTWHCHW